MTTQTKQTSAKATNANKTTKAPAKTARATKATKKKTAVKHNGAGAKTSTERTAAKKAAAKPARYTRTHALRDALKAGGTRAEITEALDKLYADHGGTAGGSGAKVTVDIHIPVLKEFGVISEDDAGVLSLTK